MTSDRDVLAQFLRQRRRSLQPEDVGLPRGRRRRTEGLRREEVALLCHMSVDYYGRLERAQGPAASVQMTGAIAEGLHLSLDERDHLFRLAGHEPPPRGSPGDHVGPGLRRILDRLSDTPAEVVSELGETLLQSPLGVALTGPTSQLVGHDRSIGYRWFTDRTSRGLYAPEDHDFLSRLWVSGLHAVRALRGPGSRAAVMADELRERDPEFREIWERHEVGVRPRATKRFVHPELGRLELACQTLVDPEQSHALLVYTAEPGSVSHDRLRLLPTLASRHV